MKKQIFLCILITIIFGAVLIYCVDNKQSFANESESSVQQDIVRYQYDYEKVQDNIKKLNESKEELAQYIINLNETYTSVLNLVEKYDKDIEDTRKKASDVESEIEKLNLEVKKEYEDMSKRIQYMYENDSMDLYEVFVSSDSIEGMLDQMTYLSEIMSYDRNKLTTIQEKVAQLNEDKLELEKNIEELSALKKEQDEQKANLEKLMQDAVENIKDHDDQIEEAESAARELVDNIEKSKNTLASLKEEESKRIKREEDSKNGVLQTTKSDEVQREQETHEQSETAAPVYVDYHEYMNYEADMSQTPYQDMEDDVKRLAAIIYCECRGEPYVGQLAVATVVMNRVANELFPNSIADVISSPYQFSPYGMGLYAVAFAMENMQQSCIDAAKAVLYDGIRVGDWLYFRTQNGIVQGEIIGAHVFYK